MDTSTEEKRKKIKKKRTERKTHNFNDFSVIGIAFVFKDNVV